MFQAMFTVFVNHVYFGWYKQETDFYMDGNEW